MNQIQLTPVVKRLLIANIVVWVVFQTLLEKLAGVPFSNYFAMTPKDVLFGYQLWQPFTYMFLHGGLWHLLLNMMMMVFIAPELENRWGPRFFTIFYVICGVGAGLFHILATTLYASFSGVSVGLEIPVVGASGALFGLMVSYAVLYGDRTIVVWPVPIPMQARVYVMILAGIQILGAISGEDSSQAFLVHLGGLIVGYIVLKLRGKMSGVGGGKKKFSFGQKKSGKKLRLVVDNDKNSKSEPKYWN
ncbi:MAG: rhomboid family intramembrane serine protease [Pseudobdellovibrionaceae bacterium]